MKKVNEKLMNELADALVGIKNREDMKAFLAALLTPAEYGSVPLRLAIVRMLKKGLPQREIVKKLGVGVATVTRGSRELKSNHFKNV